MGKYLLKLFLVAPKNIYFPPEKSTFCWLSFPSIYFLSFFLHAVFFSLIPSREVKDSFSTLAVENEKQWDLLESYSPLI